MQVSSAWLPCVEDGLILAAAGTHTSLDVIAFSLQKRSLQIHVLDIPEELLAAIWHAILNPGLVEVGLSVCLIKLLFCPRSLSVPILPCTSKVPSLSRLTVSTQRPVT
jgi:hypothetical protein